MSLIPIFTGGGGFLATGGTMYTQGGYRYHKFTSDGNFTVLRGSTTLEYLVVGGGGSGGNTNGPSGNGQYTSTGGGGGGQVINGTYSSVSMYLTIGAGGVFYGTSNGGTTELYTNPPIGSPSIVALAYGGGYGATGTANAVVGSSGGGGSVKFDGTTQTRYTAANGTAGQGNAGAASATDKGGGGGGAAGAASGITGGAGLTTYTGWWDTSAPAQIAKGGDGDTGGLSGAANTGNGGGGARSANLALQSPGNGGSGIVIIRYAV
jgi:hypothetical protein